MDIQYVKFLQERNLSNNTILVYVKLVTFWTCYLAGKEPNKGLVSDFLKFFSVTHASNSTRLLYHAIRSYLRFQHNYILLEAILDIKLPTSTNIKRDVISLQAFETLKKVIVLRTFYQKRDWIVFCLLFTTGIRAHEINQVHKSQILDNKLRIQGKGNKIRTIYLCEYVLALIAAWKFDKFNVSYDGSDVSYKQTNYYIHNFIKKHFNLDLHPHDLRRSFATNLIRQNVNIKIVAELLGHANINTTARYIHLTEREIADALNKIF